MRIPITMCHGVRDEADAPGAIFCQDHFDRLMSIPAAMGFQSINYDDLAAWRAGTAQLPQRPIMIDFDHAVTSIRYQCFEILDRYGFKGNLFVNSGMIVQVQRAGHPCRSSLTWPPGGLLSSSAYTGEAGLHKPCSASESAQRPSERC